MTVETPPRTELGPTENAPPPAARAGGLRRAGRKELLPVFAVFMTVLTIDLLLVLMLPFLATQNTDSAWSSTDCLAFLGASVVAGLAFGMLTSVVADLRGESPWWFLVGHLGAWLAPVLWGLDLAQDKPLVARMIVFGTCLGMTLLSFFILSSYGRNKQAEFSPLTRGMGRLWFACSNIWFGIGLLIAFAIAMHLGTWWEHKYGPRSAGHVFYTSWWFGGLLLLCAMSMVSATFRKYPWRIDQTGWIATHSALVLIVIGAFMTFWGKQEGEMVLKEGQSSTQFNVDTQRRLIVERKLINAPRSAQGSADMFNRPWEGLLDVPTRFDLDSSETQINRTVQVNDPSGSPCFKFKIKDYLPSANPITKRTNNNAQRNHALIAEVKQGKRPPQEIAIVQGDEKRNPVHLGPLELVMYPLPPDSPNLVAAIKGGKEIGPQGHCVVSTRDGKELLRVPVPHTPAVTSEPQPNGRSVSEVSVPVPGTKASILLKSYFDSFNIQQDGSSVDASPGKPRNPALLIELQGEGEAVDERFAYSFMPAMNQKPGEGQMGSERFKHFPDLQVDYEYAPRLELPPGALIFAASENHPMIYVMDVLSGERLTGEVVPGKPLDLGLRFQFTPKEIFTNFEEELVWEFKDHKPGAFEVASVEHNGEEKFLLLDRLTTTFTGDDGYLYRIKWQRPNADLGFKLHLRDFHRDFYPGAKDAKTFESYLWLTHDQKYPEPTGIKIDMNHPLRLDGWRLFQARFGPDGKTTILQVNRDPGTSLLYPACALLTLALVIVFSQKPFLRALGRRLKKIGATPLTKLMWAVGKVVMTFLATIPGILLLLSTPEGPMQGFSVVVVVMGLVLESLFLHFWWRPRLEQAA